MVNDYNLCFLPFYKSYFLIISLSFPLYSLILSSFLDARYTPGPFLEFWVYYNDEKPDLLLGSSTCIYSYFLFIYSHQHWIRNSKGAKPWLFLFIYTFIGLMILQVLSNTLVGSIPLCPFSASLKAKRHYASEMKSFHPHSMLTLLQEMTLDPRTLLVSVLCIHVCVLSCFSRV